MERRLCLFGVGMIMISHVLQTMPITFYMLLALQNVLFMIFIGFLINSNGSLKRRAEPLTGLLGMISVF